MKLKDFKFFFLFLTLGITVNGQYKVSGTISSKETMFGVADVEVYDKSSGLLTKTNSNGYFEFLINREKITLVFFGYNYAVLEKIITLDKDIVLNLSLESLSFQLSEVEVTARNAKIFILKRLNDVVETSIYAGKKTEVVLIDQSMASLASNNARQIYSQVAGLNIFQNDDAGLQLNIGGRGLDPNRTSNFNTRQNGYDISADVLGYPESYYTPSAEALKEVQIIRGAASLQYGTQFGGLVNFVMKTPSPFKPFELVLRNTIGSNGLYTNFSSISGTIGKFSYFSFFNYKKGNGFRPNSEFESKNSYVHLGYQFNKKTKLTGEITHLTYLAQQAGGLSDASFKKNFLQSNRERNWFQVNWLLYNVKLFHKFNEKTNFTFNAFGLKASRDALGFRTNRVDQVDSNLERDLIKGGFNNFGFESKLLHKYSLFKNKATALIGYKFYKALNTNFQGPGSEGRDPNFSFQNANYPNYPYQNNYEYPNLNRAVFGENIIYLSSKISVTPGFRFEYIKTESEGFYKKINTDAAGNVILNETINDSSIRKRSFLLLGLGASFKPSDTFELYINSSQNYRSVSFSDISTVNPAYSINPNIDDEKGLTTDFGIRGNLNDVLSFDAGIFNLLYKDRIGFIQRSYSDGSVKTERGNVGNAILFGFESLFDFNLSKVFLDNNAIIFNFFLNTSVIDSKYTKSKENGVLGKKVEFVPNFNIKTGIRFGYKNLMSNIQFTSLSSQFSDATNAIESNLSGVIGEIPAYDILDFSLSYSYKRYKLETGVNNVLNTKYFTRRATGYPGPGIIPSINRNLYLTIQTKF